MLCNVVLAYWQQTQFTFTPWFFNVHFNKSNLLLLYHTKIFNFDRGLVMVLHFKLKFSTHCIVAPYLLPQILQFKEAARQVRSDSTYLTTISWRVESVDRRFSCSLSCLQDRGYTEKGLLCKHSGWPSWSCSSPWHCLPSAWLTERQITGMVNRLKVASPSRWSVKTASMVKWLF